VDVRLTSRGRGLLRRSLSRLSNKGDRARCRKAAVAKTWTGAMIRLEQRGGAGFAFMWQS
jgi:hypothetical protein